MTEHILHSFESGRRGKPDELDANIAHLIGLHLLQKDPRARFDLRVAGGYDHLARKPKIRISGEVSSHLLEDTLYDEIKDLIRVHYNRIQQAGYDEQHFMFDFGFKPQSTTLATNGKVGDSGNPIAVAYRKSPHYLPWERFLSVGIRDLFDDIYASDGFVGEELRRLTGIEQLSGLCADGKIGVDALYKGASFQEISAITIALEHTEPTLFVGFQQHAELILGKYLKQLEQRQDQNLGKPLIIINGLGPWTRGGWEVDEGNREAKSYRDGFGTYGVMEDSFSGEDPSKPSGTGTFLARYIAVQVVGNQLSDFARVALRYTIGQEEVGLNITTNGTSKLPQEELHAWVRENIPLGIKETIERFNLCNPALYHQIVDDSDFFQSQDLPWNKLEVKYK